MARIVTKGATFKVTISASLTTIAQVKSVTLGSTENDVEPTPTLDDAIGVTQSNTGYVTQGAHSMEAYFDKASATHEFITDTIALGAASFPIACTMNGSDSTVDTIGAVGFGITKSYPERGFQMATITVKPTGQTGYAT